MCSLLIRCCPTMGCLRLGCANVAEVGFSASISRFDGEDLICVMDDGDSTQKRRRLMVLPIVLVSFTHSCCSFSLCSMAALFKGRDNFVCSIEIAMCRIASWLFSLNISAPEVLATSKQAQLPTTLSEVFPAVPLE